MMSIMIIIIMDGAGWIFCWRQEGCCKRRQTQQWIHEDATKEGVGEEDVTEKVVFVLVAAC